MTDMSFETLKAYLHQAFNISSTNFSEMEKKFHEVCVHFQTAAVKEVTVEPIPDTCYKWIKSKNSDPKKVMIFFHGGGFTMGSTADYLELIAQLVLKTNISILSVDYRCGANITFPIPLDDAKAAYLWLLKNGYDANQIMLSGISVGGMLVSQLILLCQQEKLPQVKGAVIMSGYQDLIFNLPSCHYNQDRDWISMARLQNTKKYYLANQNEINNVLLNPMKYDYQSYPKTLFQAGDAELLLDYTLAPYQVLREKNFDVHLNVVNNLAHCWQLFASSYAQGRLAIDNAARFISQVF